LTTLVGRLKAFFVLGSIDALTQGPAVPLEPVVLLQTRVWPPEPTGERFDEVNDERITLLRHLRKAFGDRFWGGLVPSEFAQRHYPELVVTKSYRHSAYIKFARRALVGVYCRGLHDSLAGKMGDYLAGSKCIVASPLRTELPIPLERGTHFLEFKNAGDLVAHCEWLLSHPREAQRMRDANAVYYHRWVQPENHLRACLALALSHEPTLGKVAAER
jgi:hypothetical protein